MWLPYGAGSLPRSAGIPAAAPRGLPLFSCAESSLQSWKICCKAQDFPFPPAGRRRIKRAPPGPCHFSSSFPFNGERRFVRSFSVLILSLCPAAKCTFHPAPEPHPVLTTRRTDVRPRRTLFRISQGSAPDALPPRPASHRRLPARWRRRQIRRKARNPAETRRLSAWNKGMQAVRRQLQ